MITMIFFMILTETLFCILSATVIYSSLGVFIDFGPHFVVQTIIFLNIGYIMFTYLNSHIIETFYPSTNVI